MFLSTWYSLWGASSAKRTAGGWSSFPLVKDSEKGRPTAPSKTPPSCVCTTQHNHNHIVWRARGWLAALAGLVKKNKNDNGRHCSQNHMINGWGAGKDNDSFQELTLFAGISSSLCVLGKFHAPPPPPPTPRPQQRPLIRQI